MANFYSNLNLKRNQLLLPVIHPSGSVPDGTNVQGQLYFDNTSSSEQLYLCTAGGDDGTWVGLYNQVMASGNSYVAGLVPTGSATHGNTYLRKDGTWGTPIATQYTAGDGLTLNTLDFDIDASQTLITDIHNTSLKIGGASVVNEIDFSTSSAIAFNIANADQVKITNGTFEPVTTNDIALGTSTKAFTYLYVNQSIQPAFQSGTDQDGQDLTISGGQSTGTGVGGRIVFRTSPEGGSSGTGQNTGVEALKIETDLKATFAGEVVIDGDLTVSGTTTTINTATVTIQDNIILLNSDQTGTPDTTAAWDAGIEVERGSATNVRMMWDEGDDEWTFTNDGSTYYAIPTANTTYDVMNASNSYAAGLVAAGSATHSNTYLRKDGTWATPVDTDTDTNTQLTSEKAIIDVSSLTGSSIVTITHTLSSQELSVTLWENIGGGDFEQVYATTKTTDVNTLVVDLDVGASVPTGDITVLMTKMAGATLISSGSIAYA